MNLGGRQERLRSSRKRSSSPLGRRSTARPSSEERDHAGHLHRLKRINEEKENDSGSSYRHSSKSLGRSHTISRAKVPKDGVLRRRRSTIGSLEHSIRALTSPSLMSVLSTLTTATSSSSGSNSTVTQKSFESPVNPEQKTRPKKQRVWRDSGADDVVEEKDMPIDVFSFLVVEPDTPLDNHDIIASLAGIEPSEIAPMHASQDLEVLPSRIKLAEKKKVEVGRKDKEEMDEHEESDEEDNDEDENDKDEDEDGSESEDEDENENDEDHNTTIAGQVAQAQRPFNGNQKASDQSMHHDWNPSALLNRVHSDSGISIGTNSSGTLDPSSSAEEEEYVPQHKRGVRYQPIIEEDEVEHDHPPAPRVPPPRSRWQRTMASVLRNTTTQPLGHIPRTEDDRNEECRARNPKYDHKSRMPCTTPTEAPKSGYERLASHLKTALSNPSTSSIATGAITPIYRKFEALNHRVLLHLQDELTCLERHLHTLDEQIATQSLDPLTRTQQPDFRGADSRGQPQSDDLRWQRTYCLGQIMVKTKMYNEALAAFKASIPPSHHQPKRPRTLEDMKEDIDRYRAFLTHRGKDDNNDSTRPPPLIDPLETDFLSHIDDLMYLDSSPSRHDSSPAAGATSPPLQPLLALLALKLSTRFLGAALLWGLLSAVGVMLGIAVVMSARWGGDDFAPCGGIVDVASGMWNLEGGGLVQVVYWRDRLEVGRLVGWAAVLTLVVLG